MTDKSRYWPQRLTVIGLCFFAIFICYIDRVNISVAILPMAEAYGWSPSTQGMVLSSFFVGYTLTQIIGGRLADRFGGKVVLGYGVLLWSLFTMLTPLAAESGIVLLIACRIAMGMSEGVSFPSVYSLVAKWSPLLERARAAAFTTSGVPMGTVFALLATPVIAQAWGWQWTFYAFGAVGILWYLVWARMASSTPREHPRISAAEITLIETGTGSPRAATEPAPWREFLTNKPLWAILVAYTCVNWSLYVLISWLPSYVSKGLGVDFESVGMYSMMPHIASFVAINLAGTVADRLIRSGVSVTSARKIMQTVGCGGMALALLLVTQVDSAWAAIAIMSAGSFMGGAAMGGCGVNPMDIAPRHAGTIMGITNTVATLPGIIAVYISGLILELTGSWALVFQTAAGVTLFGVVFYAIFASGEKQFD